MKKKECRNQGEQKSDISASNIIKEILNSLATKRVGGAINIRGIEFQILYASSFLLTKLQEANSSIHLEGVEDLDFHLNGDIEFIQVKTSQNIIDASAFWEMKVFQNFWEVFQKYPNSKFRLVHNIQFAKGNLQNVINLSLPDNSIDFWAGKFDIQKNRKDELKSFFKQITFEKISECDIEDQIVTALFQHFGVNIGTESIYAKALFYNTLLWSKNKVTVNYRDIQALFQEVKDSFSKFPINPAVQNGWISRVAFDIPNTQDDQGFYDGKAARPIDIARGLPIHRPNWEKEVQKSFLDVDITVIKSSSGQGKSTLAWLTAFNLANNGYVIYHLNYCSTYNEANAISDFILSRFRIGQQPVIVVDGLNQSVSFWSSIPSITTSSMKLIVTSREEDWIRYGGEVSQSALKMVNIQLSMSEAKDIFHELKKRKKLNASIHTWEPVWEKIKDKGLLIEYVYLLTQGEMIAERLKTQIRKINAEANAAAKIEVLRLISLADVLNIKIQTSKLTEHIKASINFSGDRNELYNSLEKEYYLKFGDRFVEGLHPVRSSHLVEILHSNISVQTSLIDLLGTIDEDNIYDYFISAPMQFALDDDYFKAAAKIVAQRSLPEAVYAIDGLMYFEAFEFWRENKLIFDDVYERASLRLFVHDAIPFNNEKTITKLFQTVPDNPNLKHLLEKLSTLTTYLVASSKIFHFVKYLGQELKRKEIIENVEGLNFLYKWFTKLNVTFPDIVEIKEDELLDFLEKKGVNEASELFHFYSILKPDLYRNFVNVHYEDIIGEIKKGTHTPTIYEKDNEIYIEYLLDGNDSDTNKQSVYRINIVRAFFPFYNRYCTTAIILPFPNEYIYKAVLQNSIKHIPPENLGDDFEVHINQIWSKTITDQYAASSSYDWQLAKISLRKTLVELARKCTRLLEAYLENETKKVDALINQVVELNNEYVSMDNVSKEYFSKTHKYFDKGDFVTEQGQIAEFFSSFRTFLNQLTILVDPTDENRHLPVINIKSAHYHLKKMQDSYETIVASSFKYFPTEEIIRDENMSLKRLVNTVLYYKNWTETSIKGRIVFASKTVNEWALEEDKKELLILEEIFKNHENNSVCRFTLPSYIVEEKNLRYAVIGLRGLDFSDNDELFNFSVGLCSLCLTGIHFFTFLFINDDNQVTGAMRFQSDYFKKFMDFLNTGNYEGDKWTMPLPLFPDENMLAPVSGLTIKTVIPEEQDEFFFRIMFDVWKLTEYRDRLNKEVEVEKQWLIVLEREYSKYVVANLDNAGMSDNNSADRKFVESVLSDNTTANKNDILQLMVNRSIEIGKRVSTNK